MALNSKQRANLRAMANKMETILQIGKGGVTDAVVRQTEQALAARELIKLRVLESALMSPREACEQLCEALGAEPVQVIGTRFVIYRRDDKDPKIQID